MYYEGFEGEAIRLLKEQLDAAVHLYRNNLTLQAIADELSLNPIKVRKLLITAGVYESEVAEKLKRIFDEYRKTQDYKTALLSTAAALQLSKASVTSYLPYEKGVYFQAEEKEKLSVGAERQRRYRAVKLLRKNPCEETLWNCIVAFQGYEFKTISGLPFAYQLKKGRGNKFTKELWIDRRKSSKSLAWSSVLLAYKNIGCIGQIVDRPKALGDIRGISYIYGIFNRFGLIKMPEK